LLPPPPISPLFPYTTLFRSGDRDGNPHVTPEVTLRVLEMQHDRGLRNLIAAVEEVAEELSTSERIQDISAELRASLDEDRRLLPSVWARFSRLNAGEPYRLKCAYIDRKSTRLNSSHVKISYAVFCLKKKNDT